MAHGMPASVFYGLRPSFSPGRADGGRVAVRSVAAENSVDRDDVVERYPLATRIDSGHRAGRRDRPVPSPDTSANVPLTGNAPSRRTSPARESSLRAFHLSPDI
jgi:hypothetical protein